jgi:DNA-binding GntR family transcriptional regulator
MYSLFRESFGRKPMTPAPTVSLAERAILALREMVHDGVLLPGQSIRQAAIAEQLGISRVPVREALKNLQADGLVEASPGGGFVVARLSADELGQIYLMRRLLETELLRRIGPVPAGEVAVLAELNARMEALIDHPSPEWKHLNRELHFRMFRLSGLPHVVAEVSRLWDKTAPYRLVYSAEHDARVRIVAEHDKLIDALRRNAPQDLIERMDGHRGASERSVVSVLSYPRQ